MSLPTRLATLEERKRVHKYPCDGVARFGVKGDPSRQQRTYSQAYDEIFLSSGGTIDAKGHRSFTNRGLLRIAFLNSQYTRIAGRFLTQRMLEDMKAKVHETKRTINITPPHEQ